MKKIKRIIAFLFIGLTFLAVSSTAQTRTSTTPVVNQGSYLDFGGVNLTPSDSLQVSDSLAYIIPINHTNKVVPYLSWYWNKIGSGTASITLNFFQGNDPTNFYALKAGVNQTTYTKSYTLSANTWSEVSFNRDSVVVDGRYLKVQLITSSTASVKGKIFGRLKTNIY